MRKIKEDIEMTNQEIKKAWNQMKKDIKNELGEDFGYGFTMSAKQLENRTATYCIRVATTYEFDISAVESEDARTQEWRVRDQEDIERKARIHAEHLEKIERIRAKIAKYGTKENEVAEITNKVVTSKAFKKFSDAVGNVEWEPEIKDCYYIRFHY